MEKPIMISHGHVSVTELGRRFTDATYFLQRPKLLPNKISGPICRWTPDVSTDASQPSIVGSDNHDIMCTGVTFHKICHLIRMLFKTDTRTNDTVMRRLTTWIRSEKRVGLGDFVVMRTSWSLLTQT
jgi:hypothetical protein